MVSSVGSGGYQAYSYQQAINPVQDNGPRSGENRISVKRDAPASDSQRADQKPFASKDAVVAKKDSDDAGGAKNKDDRGGNVDLSV